MPAINWHPRRSFLIRRQVSVKQLRWWKWHLGKSGTALAAKRAGPSTEMVRVEIRAPRPAETSPSAIEILRDGWTIRVVGGADAATLEQVLDLVASRAAC